mgnify:CR=1 FL=1
MGGPTQKHRSVFLVGLMAVGKSSVGRQLAQELGFTFVDADEMIEERAGADIPWIFDIEGEEGFRDRESQVICEMSTRDGVVLATGGGAILRESNRVALKRGYVAYLTSPISALVRRTRKDKSRPLLQGGDPEETLRRLARERGPLYEIVADATFETHNAGVKKVALQVAEWFRGVVGEEDSS